ncbi:MAG: hypothetical protein SO415_06235 [Oliverpabstia sp.]|nr:hypothetical protein [Oliverpabstia sp.]
MKSEKAVNFKTLLPFWIYFGVLVLFMISFYVFPIGILLLLSMAIPLIVIWGVIVYLVGSAVEKRTKLEKIGKRLQVSLVCTVLVVLIPGVGILAGNIILEGYIDIKGFFQSLFDKITLIITAVHFLLFWAGEEIEWLEIKTYREAKEEDV